MEPSSCEVKLLSRVWLFEIPWTIAKQAPPSMEPSRQEYWSGLPFPSPGDFPDPGIEPRSPALQADDFPSELPGKPLFHVDMINSSIMNIISSPSFFPGVENPKFLFMAWSSWWPDPHPKASRSPPSHLIRTKETTGALILRIYEDFRSTVSDTGRKTKIHSFCFHIDIKWVINLPLT